MFMMTIGFPFAFVIILAVFAHAFNDNRRSTSFWTAAIFGALYVTYMCVLAGEWRLHFPVLAIGAFTIALSISSVVGLFAGKTLPSKSDFHHWRDPRRGSSNPERMDNPFWHWCIQTRESAYGANEKLASIEKTAYKTTPIAG